MPYRGLYESCAVQGWSEGVPGAYGYVGNDLLSIWRMKWEQKRKGRGRAYVLGYFCCSALGYDVYF